MPQLFQNRCHIPSFTIAKNHLPDALLVNLRHQFLRRRSPLHHLISAIITDRSLNPGQIPFECLLSLTSLINPTKRLWLLKISNLKSFPSINVSISRVQLIFVSIEPSFKMSTIKETLAGCSRFLLDSQSRFKLTRTPMTSEPIAWEVKGPSNADTTETPSPSTNALRVVA